ncbi:uncharacterized protein LOC105437100 [Strongylocentrotus purpuratus]|uniref:Uncharacterized protein n=1 Tax=Strongylocentrotus purpuratus TaxID=7668 RepID=A0A7M7HC03_STRPU|nr:uncharacterized protein LOC105437100 [Strongylocentrotus purpuratus]
MAGGGDDGVRGQLHAKKPAVLKTVDGSVIVVDELLCFVTNKMNTLSTDEIVKLVSTCFKSEEIEQSKKVLFDVCSSMNDHVTVRNVAHKGPSRDVNNIKTCIKLLLECGDKIPTFVAKDLDRLPPVGFDNIDVSALLGRLLKLECEMADMKESVQSHAKAAENLQNMAVIMDTRMTDVEVKAVAQTPGSTSINFPGLGATLDAAAPAPKPQPNSPDQTPWNQVVRRGGNMKTPPVGGDPSRPVQVLHTPMQPKRKPGIVGKASSGRIQAVQTKLVNVFATRFDPELDADTLGDFLQEKINDTVTCNKIVTERSRFGSFHISAVCQNVEDMYDPDVWPEGVFVRRYYEPRKLQASLPGAESLRKFRKLEHSTPVPTGTVNADRGDDKLES